MDAMGRLVAMQTDDRDLTDAWIRDALLWSVSGMIDNVNTAV